MNWPEWQPNNKERVFVDNGAILTSTMRLFVSTAEMMSIQQQGNVHDYHFIHSCSTSPDYLTSVSFPLRSFCTKPAFVFSASVGPDRAMHLDILTPKPFKSSSLAVPPSPFSPRLPITPPTTGASFRSGSTDRKALIKKLNFAPPPSEPLGWLWQCHICRRCYQLGVTRRCLDDGHYFCSGASVVKRSKRNGSRKTVHHPACASEFDYQSWKAWGDWRRSVHEQADAAAALDKLLMGEGLPILMDSDPAPRLYSRRTTSSPQKDCWNTCDYPSECRWGKRQARGSLPVAMVVPSSVPPALTDPPELDLPEHLEDIELSLDSNPPITAVFTEPLTRPADHVTPEEEHTPSMDELLASAKRRKRKSVGLIASPLATAMEESSSTEAISTAAQALHKAIDDFELDFRKSLGRAGAFVSGVVGRRSSLPEIERKGKKHIQVSRHDRKRSGSSSSAERLE